MILHIKNMVCNRCIMVVQQELQRMEIHPLRVELGEAEIDHALPEDVLLKLDKRLNELGFELIDDAKSLLIEKIKSIIIQLVHHPDQDLKINFSNYLESRLLKDYTYLSNLFSDTQGITIEKFFIAQRIERVKELLVYDELSLSEIADRLGYSSVAYLSNQFKKITGLSPSHFKQIKENRRKPLDKV